MVSTIGIVSLSSGIIGEDFVKHEVDLGIQRLKDLRLNPIFLPHSLKGLDFIKDHPEARAEDLIHAFSDDSIDMILCAIGGDDTYRLLPYLFENDQLQKVIKQKIFLGFSDTTMNHLMLHKLGIKTFYGQSFLADICELDKEMLAYSLHYFKELIETGRISEIRPSDVWYEERTDFSPTALGTPRVSHTNTGFDLLQGSAQFEGKILLLETSEEKPKPEDFKKMLLTLKDTGIFAVINGLLVYEERTDFSPTALGTPRVSHTNTGFDLLQGSAQFEGKILGGCLESLYDIFDNSRYADSTELCQKYKLFPDLSDWEGKILLLETSEEKPKPEDFKKMLLTLKDTGIFAVINGLLVGKPMDETFHDDYKEALLDIIDSNIPIVYNLNVGHATPRAIVPFGVHAHVDAQEQVIRFDYNK
ncbi:MccC family protein [Streptococcus pneumoniae]|nr:MccC family protein [Streptococcus pneumoniae]